MQPNEQGRYLIEPLQIELGLWSGSYQNQTQLWLRWWDSDGNLLLIGSERAEIAEKAQLDAIPRLLAFGLTIEQIATALSLPQEVVQSFCDNL